MKATIQEEEIINRMIPPLAYGSCCNFHPPLE
jgi:hypothetical protein